jgi:protein O-GlcNAc transferase
VLGFAYAAYETYLKAKPAIQDAETVSKAVTFQAETIKAHENTIKVLLGLLQTKNPTPQEYSDLSKALTETLNALAQKKDEPGVNEALAQLTKGRTEEAKALFKRTLDAKAAEGLAANREAASAARHLGSLAYLDNTQEAFQWYRPAVELDPDNAEGWSGSEIYIDA